jgi:hypothetical protein
MMLFLQTEESTHKTNPSMLRLWGSRLCILAVEAPNTIVSKGNRLLQTGHNAQKAAIDMVTERPQAAFNEFEKHGWKIA